MTREEAGSDEKYLEEMQKSIVKAVGFMPKSVVLEGAVCVVFFSEREAILAVLSSRASLIESLSVVKCVLAALLISFKSF